MGKLVVLKLDGNLEEQGFRVTLEIWSESDSLPTGRFLASPLIEAGGSLPASPSLAFQLQHHWLEEYRKAGAPVQRIKPKRIVYDRLHERAIDCQIQSCYDSADRLRSSLEKWFDSEAFRPIDRRLREVLNPDEAARLLIRSEDPNLQKLPWHLWDLFERYPHMECAFSSKRFEHPSPSLKPKPYGAKVRILAILGHNDGINVEADRQLLERLPNAEIVFLVQPQRQDLNDRLWEQVWDIVFFAGHSETEGDRGRIYLNGKESLTISELWYALRKAVDRGLKLAIFNSCDGLGLARQLDDLRIPQMIVMRELVPDRVAQEFLKHFLTAFSGGQSFYLAVREARERLQGMEGEFPCASWLPMIYQNPAEVPPTWESVRSGNTAARPSIVRRRVGWAALVLLLLGGVGWLLGAPRLATVFNNRGFHQYLVGDLPPARDALLLALRLDPNNRAALYNQAWQCERVRDFDCARQKYRQAAKLGLAAAHSSLARLDILDRDYGAAVDLLWVGLRLEAPDPVRYALYKNLGWARLGQERPLEAEQHLRTAISIDPERASGRCLLAQVLERQGEMAGSLAEWEVCDRDANPEDPDEDVWLGLARQRLTSRSERLPGAKRQK